jgi:hypothetical protein
MAAALVAGIAACSESNRTVSSSGLPDANYTGRLTRLLSYATMGISLTPPAADAVARVDPASAYRRCEVDAACPSGSGGPTIFLALATTDGGAKVGSDGTVNRAVDHTLAYILRWQDVPCAAAGPQVASRPATTCLWIGLVDATTGAALGSGQTNISGG